MATLKNGNVTVSFADTYTPPENQTVLYNALGRGAAQNQGGGFNPFSWVGDKINAAANTFGTTISAGADALRSGLGFIGGFENKATEDMRKQNKSNLDEVYKSIGFQGRNDFINQLSQAESSGNQEEADRLMALEQSVNGQLQNVANANAERAGTKASNYQDYRKNSYIGQKINQDTGKYLGDAINTWSTMADIAGMASGAPFLMIKNRVAGNALQGALGGVANELSQNGFENFDWGRAGQNAVIGGISGAATAGLNQKWQPKTADQITSKGLKGALERGLNSQIGRGAASGALGGAIGGGLSAGFNNGDVMSGALQGAGQGAVSGAASSALMQGANKLGGAIVNRIDKTGGLANKIANNQQAYNKWLESGNTFNERLNNTITSGDSAVGNWLTRGGADKLAERGVGLSVRNTAPVFDRQNGSVDNNLAAIRDSIKNENVSYDELAYLREHMGDIYNSGDTELMQWAGIPEFTDTESIMSAYNNKELSADEAAYLYDQGIIGEEALNKVWDLASQTERDAINDTLKNSQRWQGSTTKANNDISQNIMDELSAVPLPYMAEEEVQRFLQAVNNGDMESARSYLQTASGALKGWASGNGGVEKPQPTNTQYHVDRAIRIMESLYDNNLNAQPTTTQGTAQNLQDATKIGSLDNIEKAIRMTNDEAIKARDAIALSMQMEYPGATITDEDVTREFNRRYGNWVYSDADVAKTSQKLQNYSPEQKVIWAEAYGDMASPRASVNDVDIAYAKALGITDQDIAVMPNTREDFWKATVSVLEDSPVYQTNLLKGVHQAVGIDDVTGESQGTTQTSNISQELQDSINSARTYNNRYLGKETQTKMFLDKAEESLRTGKPVNGLEHYYEMATGGLEGIVNNNGGLKQDVLTRGAASESLAELKKIYNEVKATVGVQPQTSGGQNEAVSIADFQKQGLGPRNAEQAAYRNLITTYGESMGDEGSDPLQIMLDNAEAAGLPGDSNFRKAQRLVEGGDFAITYDEAFNDLKQLYGDDFNEKIYLTKDGDWKYKNGEPYVWTTYKNKIAMALSKEMDARQNQAQQPTAKDWAKQGLKRINEDLSDKAMPGMGRLRIVDNEQDNPETELYRKLTQSSQDSLMGKDIVPDNENDITGVFDSSKYGKMQKRNWLQAAGDDYLRAAEQQKYLGMLGQLQGPTAKDAMARQIPQKLTEIGIKPENYGEFAKTSSYINGVIDDMAEQSNVRVNLPNLASELDYDNLKDIVIDSPAAVKKYQTNVKSIVAEGSNPGEYTVSQLMDASRRMNRLANSTTNQDLKKAYTNAKYTLRNAATQAMDEAGLFGDATDNQIAKGLADMGASQAVQDYYTAAVDGRSPNATDYIARTAPAEVARKIDVEMKTEPYVRSASKEPTRFATKILRSSGLEPLLNTTLRKTVAPLASTATKLAGKTLRLAGDIQAAPSLMPENQTLLYNALGRYATENEMGNQGDNANMAVASTDTEPVALLASNGPAYVSGSTSEPTTEETALYNSLTGDTTNTATVPTMGTYSAGTQSTGNSMADTLLGAMDRAAEAGDADAFATLYQMYANAVSSANSSKDMTNPVNWNSADRTKLINAQNGLSQIDTLANAYVNATGNGGDFVSGNLRNLGNMISGGNLDPTASNYNDLAQSVGMGIIKNLVNLGVTESDAERYKQYLPALTDSAEKAQMKLETLRQIYQDQINNLYSTYNA